MSTKRRTMRRNRPEAAPTRPRVEKPKWDPKLQPGMDAVIPKVPKFEGILHGRRVECSKGEKLVAFLMKKKLKNVPRFKTKEEAVDYCAKCCRAGFFVRAEQVKSRRKRVELDIPPGKATMFTEDGLYIWIYEGSKTKQILTLIGMFALAFAFLLIKVWPIWLKVIVYWLSLTLLVTQLTLIALRLLIWMPMWVVGLGDYWLLPNMLNDDLPILEAFTPLFGKGLDNSGMTAEEALEAEFFDEDDEVDQYEKAKLQKTQPSSNGSSADESAEGDDRRKCLVGIANLAALVLAGGLCCYYMGLFDAEAIPDFLVNKNELYSAFPSLAPPNASAADAEPVHTGTGMPEDAEVEEDLAEDPYDFDAPIKNVHLDEFDAEETTDLDDE